MTRQQFEILKANKHIWEYFQRVQTVNGADPAIGAISMVIVEMGGEPIDTSCSRCIASGLTSIYAQFNKYISVYGSN